MVINEMRGGARATRQLDEKAREQREHDGRQYAKQHADSRVQRLAGKPIHAVWPR